MAKQISLSDCGWIELEKLRNSTLLITGATGLVGHNVIRELLQVTEKLNVKILALVRNREKAESFFGELAKKVEFIVGDITEPLQIEGRLDYIIHGASITSSKMFVENPVETIMTSVLGMRNILELSREKDVKSVVYLSSMEAYGSPAYEKPLTESDVDYLDPLKVRSSYPESKRLCENLCVAYASEYKVPVKIARLAQTFGPGIPPTDRRAIVQFITSAAKGENIEIKASGKSARMYLYTFDAVSALLTLLLYGKDGEAYNLANKESYCSIKQLAEVIAELADTGVKVLVNTGTEEERKIYPPDSYLYLDVSKLEDLGWKPAVTLKDGLKKLSAEII